MKRYQDKRASKDFYPKMVRERSKEILADIDKTMIEINNSLGALLAAITNFYKRVEEANLRIFKHEVFDDLITMNND
jgi:hypothetical protein